MKSAAANTASMFCWVALLCSCSVLGEEALVIASPRDRQVFQRDSQGRADVVIAGVVRGAPNVIEAKADLNPGATRGKPQGWVAVAKKDEVVKGAFSGRLPLAAGGWYAVSVRARRGEEVIAVQRVEKVGAGDVFVTAGQSNSANYGRPRQQAKDDRVVYYNGKDYVPAKDPIPGGCGSVGSPWPLLGDLIVASQQVPVCFRSASLTWTHVMNWMPPDTRLYKNLVKCVREFDKNGVRAVLWHQGESDSLLKTRSETYCKRLKTIIDALNTDVGYGVPWFVAQASFHPNSKEPEEKEVAAGQQLLWARKIAHRGPVTDDLLGKEYRSDGVHFNQRGLTKHAERWSDALTAGFKWGGPSGE